MKSKRKIIVISILTAFLTVSAFVVTEAVSPKKTDAYIESPFSLLDLCCMEYVYNMPVNVQYVEFKRCQEWNCGW